MRWNFQPLPLNLLLLLLAFDEVKPRQVNASKRPVFDMPFLEFSLRKPQMKDLQAILHLINKNKASILDISQR